MMVGVDARGLRLSISETGDAALDAAYVDLGAGVFRASPLTRAPGMRIINTPARPRP
jgi:hypothetical protein